MDDAQAMVLLHELAMRSASQEGFEPLLTAVCEVAIALSEADFGNVQLLDACAGLRIAVQRGFEPWWVSFWDEEGRGQGACREALIAGSRVIVEDVESSPLFTPAALAAQRRAGVRAVQSTPLLTRDGRPLGVLSTHHRHACRPDARLQRWLDLLARQASDLIGGLRAESARHESDERFRLLTWAMCDVGFVASPDWSTLSIAEGRAPWADARSHTVGWIDVVVVPEDRAKVSAALTAAIAKRKFVDVAHGVRQADGARTRVRLRAAPRLDERGDVVEWLGAFHEATLRMQLDELAERVRAHDEFLLILGHELRHPVATLSMALDMAGAKAEVLDLGTVDDLFRSQIDVLRRLTEDLLDMSRGELDMLQLNEEVLRLSELLADAAEWAPLIASERRQHVTIEPIAADDVTFVADRIRLRQILTNLVDNACKYSGPGADIRVSAKREGADVVLRCKDNGRGFPQSAAEEVFGRQVRLDPSRADSPMGLGLGLHLVRRLAELHGGRATARSDGPGLGSEFIVSIPVKQPASPPPASARSSAPEAALRQDVGGPMRRIHALVVEDHSSLRGLTVQLLRGEGFEVTDVHSGQQALEVTDPPDVILCDMGLPDMDGLTLITALRSKFASHRPYVAIVTARSDAELDLYRERAAQFSVDEFVTKPLTAEWLHKLKSSLLRG